MSEYRLYFFDGRQHIRRAVELTYDSDDDAIAAAQTMTDGGRVELWRGAMLVWPVSGPLSG